MANRPTLFERLKQGRLFQALFVYLGATWFVLQLVGTLRDLLSLPDWIGPVTVILLAVGLVVVLATAWVQSLESTTAAEEAGERPTDWQVAPGDVLERLKSGKLPHLTWGRAVVGGLVSISLAIGAAGGYVLLTGGARLIGPTEAGADEAPAAIAVLPFQVSGADLEVYREGMVDLFSTNLDGFAGHRAVDSRTVMARWREAAGDALELDLDASLRVAGATGARYALLGNAVSAGTVVRLAADIYDLSDGTKVATGQVEGEATAILDLVDRLSVMLGGQLLGDPAAVGQVRLAAQTTSSVPALKAYLEGESLYRRSEWTASAEALERAVAEDSTFALAWSRLANTLGWITVAGTAQRIRVAYDAAQRHEALLPEREKLLIEARRAVSDSPRPSMVGPVRDYLRSRPDDAEAWASLGEIIFHRRSTTLAPLADAYDAFRRALELDPGFHPSYPHLIGFEISRGDTAEARALIDAQAVLAPESGFLHVNRLAIDFFHGGPEAMAAATTGLDALAPADLGGLASVTWGLSDDLAPRDEALGRMVAEKTPGGLNLVMRAQHAQGHFRSTIEQSPTSGSKDYLRLQIAWHHSFTDPSIEVPGASDPIWQSFVPLSEQSSLAAINQAGHLAADAGQWDLYEEGMARLETLHDEALVNGSDTVFVNRTRRRLEAWGEHRRGRSAEALELLLSDPDHSNLYAHVMVLAAVAEQSGQVEEAIGYYEALVGDRSRPYARYQLGGLYEQRGDTEKALENYRAFVTLWGEADQEVQHLVDEAREAVARLGG